MLNTALSTSQLSLGDCDSRVGYVFFGCIPEQRGLKKGKRMETDGNKMKQSDFQDLSSIFHQSIKSKRMTLNTWSKRAL